MNVDPHDEVRRQIEAALIERARPCRGPSVPISTAAEARLHATPPDYTCLQKYVARVLALPSPTVTIPEVPGGFFTIALPEGTAMTPTERAGCSRLRMSKKQMKPLSGRRLDLLIPVGARARILDERGRVTAVLLPAALSGDARLGIETLAAHHYATSCGWFKGCEDEGLASHDRTLMAHALRNGRCKRGYGVANATDLKVGGVGLVSSGSRSWLAPPHAHLDRFSTRSQSQPSPLLSSPPPSNGVTPVIVLLWIVCSFGVQGQVGVRLERLRATRVQEL